jgi:hypothetical protein
LTGNQNLQLNSILSEQTSDAQLFTSKDKFEHLAKQNPNLLKLKKELDLDIQ